ncbi:MAG: hypothetical protein QOE22_761 [Candidatus Parcubacteria bacterium]|jgi:hypothetical protein|nr:hypothetical protein [Candidatus Parcubacteria bacterium]
MERSIDDLFLRDYFGVLEVFVDLGLRCPGDAEILRHFRRFKHQYPDGLNQSPGPTLARQGFLTIEIAGHNWRTVTLHHGPLAGRSSLACPISDAPYRIISADQEISKQRLALNVLERKIERGKKELQRRTEGVKRTIRSLKALRGVIASMEAALLERTESGEA